MIIKPFSALLCVGFFSVANAAIPGYGQVELEARSNLLVNDEGFNLPPGSSFNSISPAINDGASVAFSVGVVPGGSTSHPGIWLGGGGVGGLVYEGPDDALVNSDPTINLADNIAFTISDSASDDGLYVYYSATMMVDRIGTSPVIPDSYGSPTINDSDIVGYQANFASGRAYGSTGPDDSVFHAQDRSIDPDSPYTYLYTPSFNDQRIIAAKVSTSDDFSTKVEIDLFAVDGTATRILANQATDPESPYSKFDNSLAVNANNVIAVIATRAADNTRVLLRSDGITTTEIAAVGADGPLTDLAFFAPAINDAGVVAFRARDANGDAVYVGDGESLARVIGNGDVVETDLGPGQLGQNNDSDPVFSGKPAINNRGDVAFIAGVYPQGDNQTEWGSGVFVAYAQGGTDDAIFVDGFDGDI